MGKRKGIERLEAAVDEIKNLAKEFKNRNGNSSLRISNKDFNLWLVKKMLDNDKRLTVVETRQKLFMASLPIIAAVFVHIFNNLN